MSPADDIERKPMSASAKIALRLIDERAQREMSEVLLAAAAEQGISPAEGWGFDPQTTSWARKAPASA